MIESSQLVWMHNRRKSPGNHDSYGLTPHKSNVGKGGETLADWGTPSDEQKSLNCVFSMVEFLSQNKPAAG